MIHLCNAPTGVPCEFARIGGRLSLVLGLLVSSWIGAATIQPASAQQAGEQPYVRATALLPESTAGLIRIPDFPKFQNAWEQTHLGQLIDDPSMQPFVEAQRDRVKDYLQTIDNKIGIRLDDLSDIASGEVVIAWLPFPNDKRRPFTICLVADLRNQRAQADKALEQIDTDLKGGGWQRTDVTHRNQSVRVYNSKPKPGQLKVEQIAITVSDERLIAADRDSVVTDLLDATAGEAAAKPIEQLDEFATVLKRSTGAIQQPIVAGNSTVALEWFAKPFEMGRVLRESLEIDRGNQVDVIKLLEGQGFDVVRAVGGVVAINGEKFDLLHRGFILADQNKLEKAAKMLQFANADLEPIPLWVHENVASFNRLNMQIEEAFWASEALINEAFGDEIFRDIIEGIRDDEDGPQIDIEKNVLPNLDDQIILLTDNIQPADVQSERMLLALRVKDGKAIERAIRKAMEVEPDASKLDVLPGVEIWQVQRTDTVDDFDEELFGDLELDFGDEDGEEAPPLLEHWAIALVPAGPGSPAPFLMFSSHPEFLVECAKRILNQPAGKSFGQEEEVKQVLLALKELGAKTPAFDRVVRLKRSLRVKYQLLRQGKLKDSDTVLASMYRRIFQDAETPEQEQLEAQKLPPLEKIEKFLPDGGGYFQTEEDGWAITGFLLK